MPARHIDWLSQAQWDLQLAQHAMEGGFHDWACFASQQAAEKGLKAAYQKLGGDAWGHAISKLMLALPERARPSTYLVDKARKLDQYYIPTRYVNQHDTGAPREFYTRSQAEEAIAYARDIIAWCQGLVVPEG
ncbi:MAG: HEPN domain-containing protein [Chloroflexi bacterium]|nr:HEPN domain-containing protein [Chloroflexota bacterium]